ncbi:MAG TPA: hypothetical protein VK886_22490 [Vicinamibacterales bacterium]|nr:hypothetical protein [Vicinamibacterales bacterium]
MLRVGLDMDGVVADFRSAFRDAVGALPGIRDLSDLQAGTLDAAEVKRAWKIVSAQPNWWMSLRPFEPDQITRLYTLARHWKWEVFFLTRRPASDGDSVQFQTQWWLEQYGFYLPSVLTVPGSRGEIANALRLDIVVDDQPLNCVEVISASPTKAVLMLRDQSAQAERARALDRGIGVVASLQEAIDVLERLHKLLPARRGKLLRLSDWFVGARSTEPELPMNPRVTRPVPVPPGDAGGD